MTFNDPKFILTNIAILLVALTVAVHPGSAQDAEALLKSIPADNAAEADRINGEMIQLGEDAILGVCGKMRPPGEEKSPAVRYALSELAKYASRPGMKKERRVVSGAFIRALDSAENKDIKAFFIRQIQLVGKKEAVKPLGRYLSDERLCDPAVLALTAIQTSSAGKELHQALPSARGNNRIAIMHALGDLRYKKAAKDLHEFAADEDLNTRLAVLYAIANIGGRSSHDLLKKAAEAGPAYERAKVTSYYLLYASRSSNRTCASICRDLIETRTNPSEVNIQCAALSILTDSEGKSALNDLLQAAESGNIELQAAALKLADRIPGKSATRRWMAKIENVSPKTGGQIIEMLGRRGDRTALPFLLKVLEEGEGSLCLAAVPAVARLGGEETLAPIMALLDTADGNEELQTIKETLLWLRTNQLVASSVQALNRVPDRSRAVLIDILAERRATEHLEKVFALTGDNSQVVRIAAIAALDDLGSAGDRARIINLLLKVRSDGERKAARDSLTALTQKIDNPNRRFGLLGQAMKKASTKGKRDLLQIMKNVGGEKAVEAICLSLDDPALQKEAASAIAELTLPRNRRDRGLTSPSVLIALKKAIGQIDNEAIISKAKKHLDNHAVIDSDGFTRLFNGRDLSGWIGDTKGYVVENGVLACKPGGNIFTKKEYSDFVIRFEFKLPPGGNNGLGIRAPLKGDAAFTGIEIQILDHDHAMYKNIKPWQAHGSVYGTIPAKRGFLKPTGEWNVEEVIANGRHVTVILNGETITDGNLDEASTPKTLDGRDHPGLKRDKGHIGFLGHGFKVEFRNIRIREL